MDNQIKTKVEDALRDLYSKPGEALVLEASGPSKVGGVLISAQFDGWTHAERQDRIWDLLDKVLSPYERTRVTLIVAKTPEEYEAQRESA